jgi:KaiC/GvpD/RAD55 family RecA-like ATPase
VPAARPAAPDRRASAAKGPPAAPAPASAASAPARSAAGLASLLKSSDIDRAKEDALLQLKIGREAHYISVVVAGALLVDTLLLLLFTPSSLTASTRGLGALYFLLVPALGGLYLAAFGLRVKWEEYQIWPWEMHFSVTVGALLADALLVFALLGALFGFGPTAHWSLWPAFYPLSFLSITLPLAGLCLTWSQWTQNKVVSLATSLLPTLLSVVVFAPNFAIEKMVFALALTLSVGAVLFQMTGSLLHLTASGTRAHERAVLRSGHDRLAQVARELREREESLRFREASLIGREADVENGEIGLARKLEALEAARAHANTLEAEAQTRTNTLTRLQRELAVKLAETNARARALEDREGGVTLREKELETRLPKLAGREQELIRREGELTTRDATLAQRQKEVERRAAQSTELDARLTARRQELDRKTAELLERERGIARAAGPAKAAPPGPKEVEIAERERKATEQIRMLEQQKQDLAAQVIAFNQEKEEFSKARIAHTKELEEGRRREARAAERESEAAERRAISDANAKRFEEALKNLESKGQSVDTRAALLGQRSDELDRREREVETREKAAADREAALERKQTEVDRQGRELLVQRKTVSSLEDELRLARQSVAKRGAASAEFSIAVAAVPDSEAPAAGTRARRGRGLIEGAESPLVPPEEHRPLPPPSVRKFPDRRPTGTPRLDDLLLGGIPPKGHIVLIGDAFVGKEVALYAFLAEGLKLGESAVIVTAARSPGEVREKIGLVAPQFREYEQLDMVRWVDASPIAEGSNPAGENGHFRAKGPQDLAGTVSALVKAANAFGDGASRPLRVGFLGLSASLGHADDRQRLQFLQNIVGVLKGRNAIALYTLESGTLPESQLETVLATLDGAIYFKVDNGRTFLSVQGVGDVQSRDWIEYRATNRALIVGSFALERIR